MMLILKHRRERADSEKLQSNELITVSEFRILYLNVLLTRHRLVSLNSSLQNLSILRKIVYVFIISVINIQIGLSIMVLNLLLRLKNH